MLGLLVSPRLPGSSGDAHRQTAYAGTRLLKPPTAVDLIHVQASHRSGMIHLPKPPTTVDLIHLLKPPTAPVRTTCSSFRALGKQVIGRIARASPAGLGN